MAVMGIPAQIKTDNAPAYVSSKMKQFLEYYNIKHMKGIPHSRTGQTIQHLKTLSPLVPSLIT